MPDSLINENFMFQDSLNVILQEKLKEPKQSNITEFQLSFSVHIIQKPLDGQRDELDFFTLLQLSVVSGLLLKLVCNNRLFVLHARVLTGFPGPKALPPRQHQALSKPSVAAGDCHQRAMHIQSFRIFFPSKGGYRQHCRLRWIQHNLLLLWL